MSDLYIKVQSAVAGSKGLLPLKTGQTTSYATNDDGDLERGRLTSFTTSSYLNPFGGYERFTNQTGSQTFGDGIVIDWSTWDGGSSVLGYCHSINSSESTTQTWANWMGNSPYSSSVFGDWYVANLKEVQNIENLTYTAGTNGYPFNTSTTSTYHSWTSTTYLPTTTQAFMKYGNLPTSIKYNKTGAFRAWLVRTFTISGTTLS